MAKSFWDGFKSIEHTVTSWFVKSYTAIYNAAPAVTKTLDVARPYIGGILQIVAQKEGIAPGTVNEVNSIFDQVDSSLHSASALIYDAGPTPTAGGILSSAAANLQTVLDLGHIKNPDSQALIAKAVGALSGLVLPASGAPAQG